MKKQFLFRLIVAAMAIVLALPCFVTTNEAADNDAVQSLHYISAESTVAKIKSAINDNLRQGSSLGNTNWIWKLTDSTAVTPDGKRVERGYWLRHTAEAQYGLPFTIVGNNKRKASECVSLDFTDMPVINTRGLGAVNVRMTYIHSPANYDNQMIAVDKMTVKVSLDGTTWQEGSVGIRNWTMIGSAKDPKGRTVYIYNVESENLLDIPGVNQSNRIRNVRVQPFGDFYYPRGFFSFYDIGVNSYDTLADFEREVPALTAPVLTIGEENMRTIVVEHGKMIGELEWVDDATICADYPGSQRKYMTYGAGILHRGATYIRPNKPGYELLSESVLDGKWIGGNTTGSNMGMDCMSFAYDCYSRISRSASYVITQTQCDNSLKLLGNLKTDSSPTYTNTDIIALNSEKDVYEAYALMKRGDIMTVSTDNGGLHIRIAQDDAVVVRNPDGSINPQESFVNTLEQGSTVRYYFRMPDGSLGQKALKSTLGVDPHGTIETFLADNPGAVFLYAGSTHWDFPYTFASMRSTYYAPFTLKEYETGTVRDVTYQTRVVPKDKNIWDGVLIEAAADKYITRLVVKVEDRTTGKTLYEDTEISNHSTGDGPHQRHYAWRYEKAELNDVLGSLTNGDYRLSISAQTGFVTQPRGLFPYHTENHDFTVTGKAPAANVTLSAPVSAKKGQQVKVSVQANKGYAAADVEVKFDSDRLTYVSGSIAPTTEFKSVTQKLGLVRILCADAKASAGKLAELTFTAKEDISSLSGALEIRSAGLTAANTAGNAGKAADGEGYSSVKFNDVAKNSWYRKAVDYVVDNSIMSGYSASSFGPNDTLSRAMVVQVLYNKEKQPTTADANPFPDVSGTQWYFNAVRWGAARNVVAGYGGGVFKPENPVTLEQVAVILHNYSGKPAGKGSLDGLGTYSDWAADALRWAVETGVLTNVPFTSINATASRAQTAQMLTNYLK